MYRLLSLCLQLGTLSSVGAGWSLNRWFAVVTLILWAFVGLLIVIWWKE